MNDEIEGTVVASTFFLPTVHITLTPRGGKKWTFKKQHRFVELDLRSQGQTKREFFHVDSINPTEIKAHRPADRSKQLELNRIASQYLEYSIALN